MVNAALQAPAKHIPLAPMNRTSVQDLPATSLALLRRHNLLTPLVRAEVIAEAVEGIAIEPAQATELLEAYRERNQLQDPQQLHEHLRQISFSEQDLQWQLELPLRIQAFSQREFGHKAEARFLARKEQLDRVVYSLLRVRDPLLAQELYLRIVGREANFADLAAQYAEGPERDTKGIVGPVPLTQAHPALAERLRTNRPGQLIEPFQISEWWLVTRLERYEPARFNEAVAEQMASELFQEWIQEEMSSKLAEIPLELGEITPT